MNLHSMQDIFFRCVEDSSEAIMLSDAQGVLFYVNPAWVRIYGYTSEEAMGKTPRLLHSGQHDPEFYSSMWSAIGDPSIGHWKGEIINRAKDGTLIPVILTITPFKSPEGQIKGYMGMAVDISYRKELEAKILHQDRLASIGLLASGLAHEVGTPLGVIRGRAEFIMMQSKEPAVAKNLEIVVSQIDRISKLIRSLLRVSRSFTDIRLEEVQLSEAIQEVLALVGQNLKEDFVQIRVEIDPSLKVLADFNRLEQILLNLVMNSIHAIKKAVQDGREKPHFLALEAQRNGGKTYLRVSDSGCGILPANMNKLFKPFFTTKEVGEGTGLGLAIVAQLVREINGEIQVQSTVNVGTQFTITLQSS